MRSTTIEPDRDEYHAPHRHVGRGAGAQPVGSAYVEPNPSASRTPSPSAARAP